ncbi:mitochondrial protein import protein Zim17p [Trichomonascus vanleenenianus]|uniref:Zim17p n=1 Tax=Trichomonascus vanleenenianus TaxID=2268995 RepID=UPI003EC9EC12
MLPRLLYRSVARRGVQSVRIVRPVLARATFVSLPRNLRAFGTSTVRLNEKADEPKWTKIGEIKPQKPQYQLSFTCKKCSTRSTHVISKQAYHKGTVLIECPGCKNRHLIADHLKIFSDKRITLEDIMASKGESITKGTISADQLEKGGDMEWEEIPESLAEKMGKSDKDNKE